MTSSADKLVAIIAEGLNEYAGHAARGETLANHTPCRPAYWFYGLAREQRALCRSKKFRKMLTPEAISLLNAGPSRWGRANTVQVDGVWRAA